MTTESATTEQGLADLTELPELVRALIDAVDQCSSTVMLTTPAGVIRYVNRQFTMLTGYRADEVIGNTPRILRSENTPEAFYRTMWNTIVSGQEFRGEIENRRKSGELYWENLSITPIKDADQKICFYLAIADNITVRKRLEKELHESLDLLTESNSKLQHFVSLVSHDLQSPLGNASLALEFIATDSDSVLSAGSQEVLRAAQDSVGNAVTLIRELLSYSRASRKGWEARPVDLSFILSELSEALYREIEASDAQLEYANLPTICGNETLIRELFYNIVANAIKYRRREKPRISVTARADEEGVRVTVADNGMGIPPGELEKVIEPFARGTNASSLPGTGLGLALCRQIVDVHRGTLTLDSTVGQGTKVTLYFPKC